MNRSLVFNGATSSQMVTVSIQDDMLVENQFERFFINLENYWYDPAVILNGPTASVTIEDNDSEFSLKCTKDSMCGRLSIFHNFFSTSVVTIGFNGFYSVQEDVGSVTVVVLVMMNCLTRDVVVSLLTQDNTARGWFPQCLTCMDHCILTIHDHLISYMQLEWITLLCLKI